MPTTDTHLIREVHVKAEGPMVTCHCRQEWYTHCFAAALAYDAETKLYTGWGVLTLTHW